MIPFNKRFRETTLVGLRYTTLGAFAVGAVLGSFSGIAFFNIGSWILGVLLLLGSLAGFAFAIYDLVNNEDHRIKRIRLYTSKDKKSKRTGV